MRTAAAFTLIEVVLVVVIIALIAAIVVPRYATVTQDARRKTTLVEIKNLKAAVRRFEGDCERFPTTAEGLRALVERPAGLAEHFQWKRYLPEDVPHDAWGQEYIYRHPSNRSDRDFDLLSLGSDGREGTDDDVPKPSQ